MSENQQTFFGEAGALEALSQAGDPLETLSGCIDFEAFRPELENAFIQAGTKGPGGRPRWTAKRGRTLMLAVDRLSIPQTHFITSPLSLF